MSFESLVKFIGKYYPFTLKTKVLGYAAISVLSEVAAVICLILAIERPGILKRNYCLRDPYYKVVLTVFPSF